MKDYSNVGHKTYYIGIAEDIKSCNKIRLYYSPEFPISLSNLEEIHKNNYNQDISESENRYNKVGEGVDGYFSIPSKNGSIRFNTIVYYSNITGEPIGYTIFNHLQETKIDGDNSKILEIRIFINFKIDGDVILETGVKIVNTLSSISEITDNSSITEITKKLLNSGIPYNYSTISEIKKYFRESKGKSYLKYTNKLGDLYSNPYYGLITDSTFISGGENINRYQFYIESDQILNDYNTSFSRFFIGNYKGDIVLYQWSPELLEYRVISLTESNSFNIPKIKIPLGRINQELIKGYELEYMASNYAIFYNLNLDLWGIYDLLDTTSNAFRRLSKDIMVFVDPWDELGQVVFVSKNPDTESFNQFLKNSSIYKEFLSLPYNLQNNSMSLIGKIGPWFKFRENRDSGNPIIYANNNGIILVSPEEDIIPLNNRCIISQKIKETSTEYEFYFVEKGNQLFSKSYERLFDLKDIPENDEYKMFFNSFCDKEDNNIERIILIDGLRRRPIISYQLPESGFLSSYSGILFYEKDNKITYL